MPKALVPARASLEYVLRKQYVYDYMVFFNINICQNNLEDVRMLTDFAHERRVATDSHINETPMIEQDEHFKHLSDNPTYIRPEDWRAVVELIDWIIEKNKSGYQVVNSVRRLQERKAFVRMGSGLNLQECGWHGDSASGAVEGSELLESMPGVVRQPDGTLQFEEWGCRAGQNNVIIRTDGTVAPCFPMYASTYDWGNIDTPKLDPPQLRGMKKSCQRHCFFHSEPQSGILLQLMRE